MVSGITKFPHKNEFVFVQVIFLQARSLTLSIDICFALGSYLFFQVYLLFRPCSKSKLLEITDNKLIFYRKQTVPSEYSVCLNEQKKLIIVINSIYVFVNKDGSSEEVKPMYNQKENKLVIQILTANTATILPIEIRNKMSLFEEIHGVYYD